METKRCADCGKELPLTDFYKQHNHKDGLMSYCKSCFNRKCQNRWVALKLHYLNEMGGECDNCHIKATTENYPIFAFHHINPTTVEYRWDKLKLLSKKKREAELAKCKILCSNCHILEHHKEYINSLISGGEGHTSF